MGRPEGRPLQKWPRSEIVRLMGRPEGRPLPNDGTETTVGDGL